MKMWSDVEYVYRCLADRERTLAFRAAIEAIVKPGDTVLDAGCGSGILAVVAALAGARRVFAVEAGPYLYNASRVVFDSLGLAGKIISVRKDAQRLRLSDIEKPDVVICEMVTTGLVGEMQIPVLRALRANGIMDATTRVVPEALTTSLALVNVDFDHYGIPIRFPIFVDYFSRMHERRIVRLSQSCLISEVALTAEIDDRIEAETVLETRHAGTVNALLVETSTAFTNSPAVGSCVSYCQPVVLPLPSDLPACVGEAWVARLRYRMGRGFDGLRYRVSKNDRPKKRFAKSV